MARICLIEDDKINIELYESYLRNFDHQIIVCTNGKTGIEVVKDALPDLIILDLMLPDMLGSKVYQELQKNACTKSIPVILVTAVTYTPEYKDKFKGLPEKCFLTKPIKFRTLISLISELLISQNGKMYERV